MSENNITSPVEGNNEIISTENESPKSKFDWLTFLVAIIIVAILAATTAMLFMRSSSINVGSEYTTKSLKVNN